MSEYESSRLHLEGMELPDDHWLHKYRRPEGQFSPAQLENVGVRDRSEHPVSPMHIIHAALEGLDQRTVDELYDYFRRVRHGEGHIRGRFPHPGGIRPDTARPEDIEHGRKLQRFTRTRQLPLLNPLVRH